jgi:hypothetical protein
MGFKALRIAIMAGLRAMRDEIARNLWIYCATFANQPDQSSIKSGNDEAAQVSFETKADTGKSWLIG